MSDPDGGMLRVTYMESRLPPPEPTTRSGLERIALERPSLSEYLGIYRSVGEPLRWDQRLLMPAEQLGALLDGAALRIYILRDLEDHALGFCEFDRNAFPDIELKYFGLIAAAQGKGLGPWLLSVALGEEWKSRPKRIWLHTDTWDHPAAIRVYERAGFRVYDVRQEPADKL
jgi:GNAT superfamily N-acetyltransferase